MRLHNTVHERFTLTMSVTPRPTVGLGRRSHGQEVQQRREQVRQISDAPSQVGIVAQRPQREACHQSEASDRDRLVRGAEEGRQGATEGHVTRLRAVGGVLLVAVGLIGLVIPVVPGVPLLLAGATLLGREHPLVRSAFRWLGRWLDRSPASAPDHVDATLGRSASVTRARIPR
jgi:hypothetical protein